MRSSATTSRPGGGITRSIRAQIERGGERFWRLQDFPDFPPTATAQALSRLARAGLIERLSKGIYYRGRETVFGKSRPNPAALSQLIGDRVMLPAGLTAANQLGFSTQTTNRPAFAIIGYSVPRKLIGADAQIHHGRPTAWADLSEADAALLSVLRDRAKLSELSPELTVRRILELMREEGRLDRLIKVSDSEPPRVRAMLGAIAERLGANPDELHRLRTSLNPISRFDFGALAVLPNARQWQAKDAR
jgi:Family of unknown function (DUF6088)